mgnify:CR=1 FL=1
MMDPAAPDRRFELLRHALLLFTEHGYDGVAVQQIVEAAGVTKPTLYHYFGSKLGLLEALLSARLTGLDAALAQAADYRHDLTLTLTRLARVFFIFAREEPGLYRLIRMLNHAPMSSEAGAVVAPTRVRQVDRLEQVFLSASADHGNMIGRHHAYAVTFQGMLDCWADLLAAGELTYDDHLVYRAVHQFMHGIFS